MLNILLATLYKHLHINKGIHCNFNTIFSYYNRCLINHYFYCTTTNNYKQNNHIFLNSNSNRFTGPAILLKIFLVLCLYLILSFILCRCFINNQIKFGAASWYQIPLSATHTLNSNGRTIVITWKKNFYIKKTGKHL